MAKKTLSYAERAWRIMRDLSWLLEALEKQYPDPQPPNIEHADDALGYAHGRVGSAIYYLRLHEMDEEKASNVVLS